MNSNILVTKKQHASSITKSSDKMTNKCSFFENGERAV